MKYDILLVGFGVIGVEALFKIVKNSEYFLKQFKNVKKSDKFTKKTEKCQKVRIFFQKSKM